MRVQLSSLIELCENRTQDLFTYYLKKNNSSAPVLQEAMAYSVFNGGKRIRPLLVYATGNTLEIPWENLDAPASAVELIHAYSLIHDDLPAMDNADLRRGKPACHKAFNEAIAILAGDALQALAFEILAIHPASLSPGKRLTMIKLLGEACGAHGMAAGQTLDLQGMHHLEDILKMYQLKTGALLEASVKLGIVPASASNKPLRTALEKYAKLIGLAFQLQDDLLDMESSTNTLGKPSGLDSANKKITYPTLAGKNATLAKIEELFNNAMVTIQAFGHQTELLRELAEYLLKRQK